MSTKPLAPAARASNTYSSSSNVVSMITRTKVSAGSEVIWRSAPRPSSPGIRMSIRTTSGTLARTSSIPASPSAASPTSSVSGSVSIRARSPIRTSA